MQKIIVIYKSKYGRSKKYARWISEKLECEYIDSNEFDANDLGIYDTIVYGAGIYAGSLSGIDWVKKFNEDIVDKNIIIFTCGITDTLDEENTTKINEAINKEIPENILSKIKIFNFRGGIDYPRLSIMDKAKISVLKKVLESKNYSNLTVEERKFAYEYDKSMEFTSKEYIKDLIEYIKDMDEEN